MSSRVPVLAGLVLGALAAVAVLAVVVLVPGPLGDVGVGVARPSPSATVSVPPSSASHAGGGSPTGAPGPGSPGGGSPGSSGSSPAAPSGSAAPSDGNFGVGRPAPALEVPQVGGGTIDLAALRGRPVWVNFMATWCPPCIDEFPLMNGYAARYADAGLVVVAVDVREDEGTVAAFAQSLDASFPIGLDADGSAQREWGAHALPVHFWVDADGVIRHGALGGIGPDAMAEGLAAIMPGVEVTP